MSRLLLVDDDPGTLSTYGTILRLAGYEVVTTSDGREGLALLHSQNEDFQLILLDLRLPDLSGLEVLAEARAHAPNVPVVIMSAWGTEASEVASRQLGAVDFVHKLDVDTDVLERVVRRHICSAPRLTPEQPDALESQPSGYAAQRWAEIVVAVTRLKRDVPTLRDWAREIGRAATTIKSRCAVGRVHAGDSLDFGRVLRVVIAHVGRRCDWHNAMDIVDPRTVAKLLDRAGLSPNERVPDVPTFLRNQRLIASPDLLAAVRERLGLPRP